MLRLIYTSKLAQGNILYYESLLYICESINRRNLGFLIANKKKETDEELLRIFIKTGDNRYLGYLYERYIPLVYGVCLKYLEDAATAQDAVMDIFEFLLQKAATYNIKIFRPWLYTVVKNHCLRTIRDKKKENRVELTPQFMESEEDLSLFDMREMETRDQLLTDCLDKLPETQRITVQMFFMQEQSYLDIAEKTGFQLKSVKSYLQNGKRNLKNCMEKGLSQ